MNLNDSVSTLKYISSKYTKLLEKLGIFTVKDLLTYFPRKYLDTSETSTIADLCQNAFTDLDRDYLIKGEVSGYRNNYIRSRMSLQRAILQDETGQIECVWFNQPYLTKVFEKQTQFLFLGRPKIQKGRIVFYPKILEKDDADKDPTHLARIVPEYQLTAGISKKWFRNRVMELINMLDNIDIRNEIDETYDLKAAIKTVHFPDNFENLTKAIDVLSIYEITEVLLKVKGQKSKVKSKLVPPKIIKDTTNVLDKFINKLPFELTKDQVDIITKLSENIYKGELINSLIQGDVGSGKTIIAIALSLITAQGGYQVAILAPTTILAKQHFDTFKKFLEGYKVSIELVSSENKKSQSADILIGTSAILARKQNLIKNLGMIVVDEQHRFGVKQREELLAPFAQLIEAEGYYPHFINMSATPIPRTIAQVFFGDIDIKVLTTKPSDRKPIETYIAPETKRGDSIGWMKEKLKNKDQIFWVCPLITDSEKINANSAESTFEYIKNSLPEYNIQLLHGRMKDKEKNEIMQNFLEHKAHVLVSTSVIEVGIDVPNASVMVIENAERFGLAQLHQIRGRVGRGIKQSYCFLFYGKGSSERSINRLKFLSKTLDGMKIAEYDLETRGPGEVYGEQQAGIPNLKIATFSNIQVIKQAKKYADELFKKKIYNIELFKL